MKECDRVCQWIELAVVLLDHLRKQCRYDQERVLDRVMHDIELSR